jgi:hypothetical protein
MNQESTNDRIEIIENGEVVYVKDNCEIEIAHFETEQTIKVNVNDKKTSIHPLFSNILAPFNPNTMRNLILFALMSGSFAVNAQKLDTDKTDEFTGSKLRTTELELIGRGPMTAHASMFRVDDTYGIYMFTMADIGCAGAPKNYLTFLFSDGTKFHYNVDHSDIDCSDTAVSTFIVTPSDFDGKTVTKFRLCRSESYYDFDYTAKYTMEQFFDVLQK